MRRLLKYAVIAVVPLGIPVAIGVWVLRRVTTKNRVTVVHVKPAPVLKIMKGGRA